jgi:hypothetical protein
MMASNDQKVEPKHKSVASMHPGVDPWVYLVHVLDAPHICGLQVVQSPESYSNHVSHYERKFEENFNMLWKSPLKPSKHMPGLVDHIQSHEDICKVKEVEIPHHLLFLDKTPDKHIS